ncbi:MAG: radical SAM family heme chaperone HemW [Hyphomicrobiaceae bacterium]
MSHRDQAPAAPSDAEPGFAVYVHWPFCAQKCPYCDFNSHVRQQGWDEARFRAAYLAELGHMAALSPGGRVHSVFFGGGTPSLMQPATTAAILDEIARLWPVEAGAEITLEANPSSVEADRFRGYRSAGVNRVSLGVQSLRDGDLRRLGRLHDVAEAKAAIAIAKATFARVSFDLIYARPGQTEADWRAELAEALDMAEGHLSLYQLTIEEGTPFARLHATGKLVVPEPEVADRLYDITQDLCGARGLPPYEISNHAAPGQESRHNLVYWRYGTYAGVGPGAHGRLLVGGRRRALSTERNPERWAEAVAKAGHGLVEDTALTAAEEADEMLLMGLRLAEGIDLGRLARVTGHALSGQRISELAGIGMLEGQGNSRIRATRAGRFVLNEIVRQLAVTLQPVGPQTA